MSLFSRSKFKRKDIPLSTKHLFVIAEKINIDLVNRN